MINTRKAFISRSVLVTALSALVAIASGPAAAEDLPKRPWTMALAFENDIFAGTDRYYTQV
jgi:hypothetical protein